MNSVNVRLMSLCPIVLYPEFLSIFYDDFKNKEEGYWALLIYIRYYMEAFKNKDKIVYYPRHKIIKDLNINPQLFDRVKDFLIDFGIIKEIVKDKKKYISLPYFWGPFEFEDFAGDLKDNRELSEIKIPFAKKGFYIPDSFTETIIQ